jgi:hypothetical protein
MVRRLLISSAVLVTAACDCGGKTHNLVPQIQVVEADMTTARTSVDFGLVQINVKGVQKVHVRNDGNGTLTIDSFSCPDPHFGVDDVLPLSLEPGEVKDVSLTFSPLVPDLRVTSTLTLSSNDPSTPKYDLMVAGQGVTAVAKASPNPLDFGDVYVNESKQVMLTVTNTGGNDLPVMTAKLTGSPAGVTGDFTNLTNAMVPAGGSVSVPLTFTPTVTGAMTGGVEIDVDPVYGTNLSVPLMGRGTQALPQMCFKFDDLGMEQCTDQTTTTLNVVFGSLCDNNLFTCAGMSGQRTGTLYFKNVGNVPVKYSATYTPYPYSNPRCDAGMPPHSDFTFANVPDDGGAPMPVNMATSSLPMMASDPMPWQTTPIAVGYRATSRCTSEGADQATVVWTRQDPIGTTHLPQTLLMTLTGGSLLPAAKAKPVNIGQANAPAAIPFNLPLGVELVTNEGQAPLTLTSADLFEDCGMTDGGCLNSCANADAGANCKGFIWADGGIPSQLLPVTLDGGANAGMPSQKVIGKLFVGCAANDGSCPTAVTHLKVYAVVQTSDPYAPTVTVPLNAYVQGN